MVEQTSTAKPHFLTGWTGTTTTDPHRNQRPHPASRVTTVETAHLAPTAWRLQEHPLSLLRLFLFRQFFWRADEGSTAARRESFDHHRDGSLHGRGGADALGP